MREKISKQSPPAPTASTIGPCPTVIQVMHLRLIRLRIRETYMYLTSLTLRGDFFIIIILKDLFLLLVIVYLGNLTHFFIPPFLYLTNT